MLLSQAQRELEEYKSAHSLPYEELNRVIKERDRISEERDELFAEVKQLRAEVAELRPMRNGFEAEKNELLTRYENEKREIRNYMMKQDQSLLNVQNAYEHQKQYTRAILSKLSQRSMVLKSQHIVTVPELQSTAPSFKWDIMFDDVEAAYNKETGSNAKLPAEPPIPPVEWNKEEFLARLQRHFAASINSPPPADVPRRDAEPEPEKEQIDESEREQMNAFQREQANVDLDGRPLPPGWTNEEHVSPFPFDKRSRCVVCHDRSLL